MSSSQAQPHDGHALVVVGTGFASTFFLRRYLERAPRTARVLVLERGRRYTHREQLAGARPVMERASAAGIVNATPGKPWLYMNAFGGGSNCWYACTPRMLPDDFRVRSRFGFGEDWPVSYDELEPYYSEVEEVMQVAGPNDHTPFRRSRPYPQPPHRMNAVDLLFKKHFPSELFAQPTARPSRNTANRPACCGNGVCHLCPVDSKFTVENELSAVYADPRVTLQLESTVQAVELAGGRATGVRYLHAGREVVARGELVVLGANALYNPHILLRSGMQHAQLGRGIGEQVGAEVTLHLDGVDNYGGGTWVIGHWYGMHQPEDRARRAAALVEIGNAPLVLRPERGKWRQVAVLRVIYEDVRRPENVVRVSAADPTKPEVIYAGWSAHTQRGLETLDAELTRRLAKLPIERILVNPEVHHTEAHILGSVVMGNDPRTSVVDRHCIHHTVRNLMVLGGSAFPSMAPANPTLTISALSLWAADAVTGGPKRLM
jgi:choline dehydrogenase-like flavoprotein